MSRAIRSMIGCFGLIIMLNMITPTRAIPKAPPSSSQAGAPIEGSWNKLHNQHPAA